MSDRELLGLLLRAGGGDGAAAARVYDATAPAAWRLALALTGSGDAARTLVLEGYRAVWADAAAWAGSTTERRPLPWILATLQHTVRCAPAPGR